MKKQRLLFAVLILFFHPIASGQSYKKHLEKINTFLKTFDNGYYGYLEIKDGYLYDRFPSGKYSKSEIKYLGKAYVADPNKKVSVNCIDGKDCVFSTYTDSYHSSIGFSQTTDFNTSELIKLLDNLITAYKENNTVNNDDDSEIDYAAEKRKLESLKSTVDITSSNSAAKNNSTGNYQPALKKLNDYLKTFDNGYYGYFEVKDGYIFVRFKAGKYNKFKMEDMEGAVIQEQYNRVIFKCKGDNKCISTDWKENGKEEYTQFVSSGSYNYQELATLLNDFRDAYLGKKTTSAGNSTESVNKSRNEKTKERQRTTGKSSNEDDEYNLKSSNDADFKKGDKIIIKEVYSLDNHYRNGGKSLCVGEKGTILSIGYDEINFSYYGKIKMDNGKIEEFNDFEPELISSIIKNKETKNSGEYEYDGDMDEDWDKLEKAAVKLNNSTKAVKETTGTLAWIPYDKEIILADIDNSDPSFDKAKKYIGKQGKTKTYLVPNKDNLTFYGDIYFDGKVYTFKKIKVKEVANAEQTVKTETSGNKNYAVPLQKLNEYLKTFNTETYDRVEVKDNKVIFYFKVYTMVYNSSISISDLTQNTTVLNAKAVGEFGTSEIKIFCKNDKKYFYSTYSNGNVDHFRFFSYTVKDLTKMEQLLNEFIKSL